MDGVGQFKGIAATTGTVTMKKPIPPKTAESFTAGLGRGLRLAARARSARKTTALAISGSSVDCRQDCSAEHRLV
jgi:hypothetical protein